MNLKTYVYPTGLEVPLQDRIKHLRISLTVHSYIYYDLNDNIISDEMWQHMADELTMLQLSNPELCTIGVFDAAFKDWNGSTGMHLNKSYETHNKAITLLRIRDKKKLDD